MRGSRWNWRRPVAANVWEGARNCNLAGTCLTASRRAPDNCLFFPPVTRQPMNDFDRNDSADEEFGPPRQNRLTRGDERDDGDRYDEVPYPGAVTMAGYMWVVFGS